MQPEMPPLNALVSRWKSLVAAHGSAELTVEISRCGEVVLRRPGPWHRIAATDVFCELATQLGSRVAMSLPVANPAFGVLVPDIVWMSDARWPEDIDAVEPLTVVPDVCVEVLDGCETDSVLPEDRVSDYLTGGVKEIILVEPNGTVRFWGQGGERTRSAFDIRLGFNSVFFRQCETSTVKHASSLSRRSPIAKDKSSLLRQS